MYRKGPRLELLVHNIPPFPQQGILQHRVSYLNALCHQSVPVISSSTFRLTISVKLVQWGLLSRCGAVALKAHSSGSCAQYSCVQGWLPKPGAQFGGHFVLYRSHPEVDHAEYVVRCMRGRHLVSPTAQGEPASDSPQPMEECQTTAAANGPVAEEGLAGTNYFAWPELLANVRVAGQVRKRLVLLYVHFPADADHGSPSCLQSATVCTPP